MLDHQSNAKQPTLKQLECFAAVCLHGNFRRAAERVGISQPTLTAQISALEETLGVQLFERSRRGTQVTPEAEDLVPQANRVLEEMRAFVDKVNNHQFGPVGTYKLGVTPTLGPYFLPHILPAIHQEYSSLKLYVREASPVDLKHDLLVGRYDCILTPLPITTPELSVFPLFNEPLKLVVAADHDFADHTMINANQLQQQNVLSLEDHHHLHRQVASLCERLGARLNRDYEGTSLDTLRQMVVMGMGVAFLPGLYIHSEIHRPEELKILDVQGEEISRTIALVWRKTAPARFFFQELGNMINNLVKQNLSHTVSQDVAEKTS